LWIGGVTVLVVCALVAGCGGRDASTKTGTKEQAAGKAPPQAGDKLKPAPNGEGQPKDGEQPEAANQIKDLPVDTGDKGPWTLRLKYKKGERHTYAYKATVTGTLPPGMGDGADGEPQTRVEEGTMSVVAKDVTGKGTVLDYALSQKVEAGEEPRKQSWTVTVDSRGVPVDEGKGPMNIAENPMQGLGYPEKPVKPGDKWTVKHPNPAAAMMPGTSKEIEVHNKLIGLVEWEGQKALKVESRFKINLSSEIKSDVEGGGPGPNVQATGEVSVATTYYLDPATGQSLGVVGKGSFKMSFRPSGAKPGQESGAPEMSTKTEYTFRREK
jgi:hypothetical protein